MLRYIVNINNMKEPDFPEFDINSIASDIARNTEDRIPQFRSLPLATRSMVFNILSPNLRQEILSELSFNEAVELLDHLDLRRVHHILSKMKDKRRKDRLVRRIKSDRFEKIEYFLQFYPDASISLVHLNYVYLPEDSTIGDTAVVIEDHIKNTGKIPVILVSRNGELVGEIGFSTLVKERNTAKLRNHFHEVKAVAFNEDKEKILSLFTSSSHEKVVITDIDGSVIGLVYSDDVLDMMESQPAVSLYNFASVESSERPFDGPLNKVKGRYKWLIINLFTCFLAAGVVSTFENAIDKFVVLAVLMPIVSGMGGNAATQTLAVMVRGIAIGEINLKNARPAIINEVLAGLMNGLLTGLILIPVVMLMGMHWSVALLGAGAVVFGLVIAGFFGAIMPLILKHFGKDPATSAGILISTANDVLVYLFLLGLATIFFL